MVCRIAQDSDLNIAMSIWPLGSLFQCRLRSNLGPAAQEVFDCREITEILLRSKLSS